MGSRITSLLVAVLAASAAFDKPLAAQEAGNFVLGARAGTSIATLAYESDPGADIGYHSGLAVGVSATYYLTDNVGVRLGGAFASKGARATFEGMTSIMRLSYLDLMPLLDLNTAIALGGRKATLYLLIGPTVSVNRLCKLASVCQKIGVWRGLGAS